MHAHMQANTTQAPLSYDTILREKKRKEKEKGKKKKGKHCNRISTQSNPSLLNSEHLNLFVL